MNRRGLALLTVLLSCLIGACRAPGPITGVDSYDAAAVVHGDGTVVVRETITATMPADARTFERRVTIRRADGLVFDSAALDGRTVTTAGGALSVSAGRSLVVRWALPAASGRHTFGLVFRAIRGVEIHGTHGALRLSLLDAARGFSIARARLSLEPADGVRVEALSGVAEAGWTVTRTEQGVDAVRQDLPAAETATIAGTLGIDPSRMIDPTWQMNEERAADFLPAFASGALFILVIGVGIVWIVRLEHPRRRKDDEDERRVVRRGLRMGGLASVLFSFLAAAATWWWLGSYGPWAMAIPASILVVGLLLLAVSAWIV
jgi:hypothetical protein